MEIPLHVISLQHLTPSIACLRFTKPNGFRFISGHSAMLSINKPGLREQIRPFTFTATNDDAYLECIIKNYPATITQAFHDLRTGDELLLHAVFGSFRFAGAATFIAGGMGITPFIAMLRHLNKEHKLANSVVLHSVKTSNDLVLAQELHSLLGERYKAFLTQETNPSYFSGRINAQHLATLPSNQPTMICGPPRFIETMRTYLATAQHYPS